jgi:hypothetical protein
MKHSDLKKSYGPQGQAQVTVGKRSVAVIMTDTHIKYEFPLESVPDSLKHGFTTGVLKVSFSEDTSKILSACPWSDKVIAKVKNFGGNGAQVIPVPRLDEKPGHKKDGGTFPKSELWFGVNFDIVSPVKYLGMSGFGRLLYFNPKKGGFTQDEANPQLATLSGKHRDVVLLDAFLNAVGIGQTDFAWSDNLLPAMLSAIQNADKEFAIVFKDGWPVEYEAIAQATTKKKPVRKK